MQARNARYYNDPSYADVPIDGYTTTYPGAVADKPYTYNDALENFKWEGNQNPSPEEVNEWVSERNMQYFGQPGYEDIELDGLTSEYVPPSSFDFLSTTNIAVLAFVLLLAGLFYKLKSKKVNEDDEYVKSDSKGVMDKLYNPFNRKPDKKGDKDDDFDHVL